MNTTFRSQTPSNLTTRDGYIVSQALVYAIAAIQNLPEDRQEWSNMHDMCIIARSAPANNNIMHVMSVERHTGLKVTLWPEPDAELSQDERARRDEFSSRLEAIRKEIARRAVELMKDELLKKTAGKSLRGADLAASELVKRQRAKDAGE